MRKKTSNLKTVVHFSLAIGLIVGIWMMSNSGSSDYTRPEKNVDSKKEFKKPDSNNNLNATNVKRSEKLAEKNAPNSNEPVKEVPAKKASTSTDIITSMRTTFDCTDAEQVKVIQKELNLVVDGIYGPNTEAAWKAKLASLDGTNSTSVASATNTPETKTNAVADDSQTILTTPQPKVETDANVVVKTSTKPTALNSTKPTDPNNNAMLD